MSPTLRERGPTLVYLSRWVREFTVREYSAVRPAVQLPAQGAELAESRWPRSARKLPQSPRAPNGLEPRSEVAETAAARGLAAAAELLNRSAIYTTAGQKRNPMGPALQAFSGCTDARWSGVRAVAGARGRQLGAGMLLSAGEDSDLRRSAKAKLLLLAAAVLSPASVEARNPGFSALSTPRCELSQPFERARPRTYAVAAIGDSITDTRVGGGLYMKQLSKLCPDSRFDAYGVGGQRTEHMRWRFMHDVFGVGAPRKPPAYTHLIVLGGVNDLSAGSMSMSRTTRIRANLSYMYGAAAARGIEVIALTVPPWGLLRGVPDARVNATVELNRWITSREAAGEVDFALDIGPLLRCPEDTDEASSVLCAPYRRFPTDLVHWNEVGHRRVAELLKQRVFADCR